MAWVGGWALPRLTASHYALRTPKDLVYASGSAGQALYLVPSLELTVVHFGASASFRHETFLRRLFR